MTIYRHARFHGKVQKILDAQSQLNRKLVSVVMSDMMTRYDMFFEDSIKKYTYIHEHTRFGEKVVKIIDRYEQDGYKLVFHVMGDLATRHELFFEKEVQ